MSNIDSVLEKIKEVCKEHSMSFAQAVCEAFYLFDDEFEEMTNSQIINELNKLDRRLRNDEDVCGS